MKSAAELFAESKARVPQVTAAETITQRAADSSLVLIDVREDREWNLGHAAGATHMSRGTLESKIDSAVPRDATVVLYCASGNRSALAAESLAQMGYTNVSSMAGGFRAWVDANGDIEG
ncbi:MAG: rhodanese-like domain-containing protein [Gemmatimonadota bacterium]